MSKYNALDNTNKNLRIYLDDVKSFDTSLLSKEEEELLTKQYYSNHDEKTFEKIFLHNIKLVLDIAYDYRKFNIDNLDIIQEGNIGLMKAIRNFNPYSGYHFSTFATPYIKGSINRYISNTLRTVRLPVGVVCDVVKYENLVNKYVKEYGCMPDPCYVMEQMNISKKRYDYIVKNSLPILSLDRAIKFNNGNCEDINLLDLIPSSFGEFNDVINNMVFEELFLSLNEQEEKIIKMLFGIKPYKKNYTETEVGLLYGLSPQRISQIKYKVLEKLKNTDAFKDIMDEDIYLNDNVISR